MTDYNSMKADEYARRQGEIDDMERAIVELADKLFYELPSWAQDNHFMPVHCACAEEAKRRVMQAIKERGEP